MIQEDQYEFHPLTKTSIGEETEYQVGYPLNRKVQSGGQNIENLYIPFGHVVSENRDSMNGGKYSSSIMQQAMNQVVKPLDDWMYDQLFENASKSNPTHKKSLKNRESKNKTAKK
jgi:hypothetical protein